MLNVPDTVGERRIGYLVTDIHSGTNWLTISATAVYALDTIVQARFDEQLRHRRTSRG